MHQKNFEDELCIGLSLLITGLLSLDELNLGLHHGRLPNIGPRMKYLFNKKLQFFQSLMAAKNYEPNSTYRIHATNRRPLLVAVPQEYKLIGRSQSKFTDFGPFLTLPSPG